MNPRLEHLQPYPFEKLVALKQDATPPAELDHIALSIGEPKHVPPQFVLDAMATNLGKLANYPTTKGLPELRTAMAEWATRRFKLESNPLDPEQHILGVNGTREALFAFAQAVINTEHSHQKPIVISPNPFYQIYEGACLLAGAELHLLDCVAENRYLPDFDSIPLEALERCQLMFICNPGNPTGAVIPKEQLRKLITLADEHDFIIASDECYSELYFDEQAPPPGLLEVCHEMGRTDYQRCVVFHSLSKRSNLPGLRSGFVAGDASIMKQFLLYRTYHGCSMPLSTQLASISAWQDEHHVRANRDAYRQKFDAVLDILHGHLEVTRPDASFYLWPQLDINDEVFAKALFSQQNITVLPGSYLGRENTLTQQNPGTNHIRMALVATVPECIEAAERIKACLRSGNF
ncbi:succinyldiaminopimelate transaminase [Marinibactrum halimedae]|uniref:Succinyldiaminopimelate transaminase n=1 Tax=Marinibactrum halimedae TaxID=1444977 RepID=A0AA37TAM7_9GAMM|nr:succinyldiaminopimelate transaminase [Marinibactrum halimedae]MCD9457568.1 succinyldiaminopimelate transaminase [Marinibactrum halimedae]GLS27988.1 succinyldiaminopimelate transaminase [Marinibactrum halimedae]